ncbi:MAG TPA: hypothetical protein VIL69_13755 [Roseomonas sp.]|jgi:hypothetical protein
MPALDGLIPLPAVPAAVLKLTGTETDPIARASVRERRVRAVVAQQPDLAARIGGRLFVLDQEPKLRAIAAALGLTLPTSAAKPSRAHRASSSNGEAAVAA